MKKIILMMVTVCLLINLASAGFAVTDASFVSFGRSVNLTYVPLTDSYQDDGSNNPNIVLRLYSDDSDDLKGYAGLVYSDKEMKSFILISPNIEGTLDPIGYYEKDTVKDGSLYYRDTDISISTSRALYPGIIYAVISHDPYPSSDDELFRLDPADEGWLMGADGGSPCFKMGEYWVTEKSAMCNLVEKSGYGCSCKDRGAEEYDSFDIAKEQSGDSLRVTATNAYFLNSQGLVEDIKTVGSLIIELRDADNFIDSQKALMGDTALFDLSEIPGDTEISIYVNGILTDVIDYYPGEISGGPEVTSSPSGSSSGSSLREDLKGGEESEDEGSALSRLSSKVLREAKPDIRCADTIMFYSDEDLDYKVSEISVEDVGGIFGSFDLDMPSSARAFIRFSIPRDWLLDIGYSDVSLYLRDDKLDKVETTLIDEDQDYVYFMAQANVGGIYSCGYVPDETEAKIGASDDISSAQPETKKEEETVILDDSSSVMEDSKVLLSLIYMLAVILVIMFIALSKSNRRKKPRFKEIEQKDVRQ